MVSSQKWDADEVTHANRSVRLLAIYNKHKRMNPTFYSAPDQRLILSISYGAPDFCEDACQPPRRSREKTGAQSLSHQNESVMLDTHVGVTGVPARRPRPVHHRQPHVRGGGAPAGRVHLPDLQHAHAREGVGADEIDGAEAIDEHIHPRAGRCPARGRCCRCAHTHMRPTGLPRLTGRARPNRSTASRRSSVSRTAVAVAHTRRRWHH